MNHFRSILPLCLVLTAGCDLLNGKSDPNNGTTDIDIQPPNSASSALVYYETCDDLLTDMRASIEAEMTARLLNADNYYYDDVGLEEGSGGMDGGDDAPAAEADAGGTGSAGEPRTEGEDFSGTNNQEEGVDEADFVKTDGYHIYVLNGNRLEILGVPEFGELNHASTTEIEGQPIQMLLGDDRIVVFSRVNVYGEDVDDELRDLVVDEAIETNEGYYYYRYYQLTKATVIDISDRTAPSVAQELFMESSYKTARRVDQSIWMVGYAWRNFNYDIRYWPVLPQEYWELDYDDPRRDELFDAAVQDTIASNIEIINGIELDELLPRIYEQNGDSYTTHMFSDEACQNFAASANMATRGVTSILSLDLLDEDFGFDADHVMANWPVVYASQDTMLIAEPEYDWWWYWSQDTFEEQTNIHRFDISTPGQTEYTGSGAVPGYVYGQFALSEYNGDVRVATTTNSWLRWWQENPPEMENHVYVLGGKDALYEKGHVSGMGIGERIWSSRFVGDKAYVVTFRQIDPLYTVDLSDPFNPEIIGELKIEGVSTYIHPMDDKNLLTIGFGGDENGLDWRTQVNIFDVSDMSNPSLASSLSLAPEVENENEWNWAWSEATYEHKAFQYWGPMSMLAVPLSTYRYVWEEAAENGGADGSSDGGSDGESEGETEEPVGDDGAEPEEGEDAAGSEEGETTSSDESDTAEDSWSSYYYEYVSQLALINAESGQELTKYGSIDHSDFFNNDNQSWWRYRDVRRSIFMGDYIYAISDRGVTAHKLEDLTLSAEIQLAGSTH